MQSHRGARALLVPPPLKREGVRGRGWWMATTILTNMLSSMFQTVYPVCHCLLECASWRLLSIVAQGREKHLDIGLGQQA